MRGEPKALPHLGGGGNPDGSLSQRLASGLLMLILFVGSLVRFVGLGKESLWLDEATSIIIARMNLSSVIAWAAGDIHPPLYYLTLHFWLCLGESEFAVRSLSAVLGVLTIVVLYALTCELFGQRTGLLAAWLLALSPLHIVYSQETRMYVMVTLWSLLASYWLVLALRRQKTVYWLSYVLSATLALYTHYFALFVLFFQGLFALYWFWRHPGAREWVIRWLLAELAIALLFLPWVPILYHQATTGGGGWVERSIGRPTWRALVDTGLYFSVGLNAQLYPILVRRAAYALFAICALAALWQLFSHPKWKASVRELETEHDGLVFGWEYIAVPLVTVWLLSQVKPMYTVRYLLPFLPAYCMIVAYGALHLAGHGVISDAVGLAHDRRTWLRFGMVAVLTGVLFLGDWNAWRSVDNTDWRSASSYVMAHAEAGDVVLFSPRWNEKPFDYYAHGRVPLNMDLPIPVTDAAARQVVANLAQQYRRVWLFWERGHYSDPQGAAKRILDSHFALVEEHTFHRIDGLFLYDLAIRQSGS